MSHSLQRTPWPPLIQAALPAWMRWRDAVLTWLMWGLLAWLVRRQFRLVSRHVGGGTDLEEFAARLAPYAGMVALLIGIVAVATVAAERRRRRSLRLRPPAPLTLADEARGVGMDEEALAAARRLAIVVVHVEGGGRLRIEGQQALDFPD